MYYITAETSSQPDLIQISGRLTGVFNDDIPITLYTNAVEDIAKAHRLQEKLINARRGMNVEQIMRSVMEKVPIKKSETTSKRKYCKDHTFKLNVVKKHQERNNTGYFKILPETLGGKSREYYNQFVQYFTKEDGPGTGKWESKAKTCREINGAEYRAMENATWDWHNPESNTGHWVGTNETSPGLLFRFDKGRKLWSIRYNLE
jgi:hypothetical protein